MRYSAPTALSPKAFASRRFNFSTSHGRIERNSIAQLDVPVSEIDEVFPQVVLRSGKRNLHKWPPLRPLRFADQAHVRFTREPVAFARITWDARANDVLPRRHPASVARHDMIEVEFAAVKNLAAVLAGVLVPLEHVVPGKFHFLLRKPVENQKHNHTRDTNLERNRRDYFVVRRVCRIYQREGATRRADVNRLPEAVKHQDLTV